ncbi:MAG: sodium:solute symporter [Bacteroidota bacterium]
MTTAFGTWDIGIILLYFGIIFWIARWASRKKSESGDSVDYFLAGKDQGWLVVGASLFASNIGSEIILGVSGAGARANMPMANFEILASLILILLGWVFVPFYLRTGVYTMPEFLEKRYSKACRNYLSIISLFAYVITKISLIIFAGALVFETMGIPFWIGAITTVVATGLYTVLGGLRAVIYTDMVQAFILLIGTSAVTWLGLNYLGGWSGLMESLSLGHQAGGPPPDRFFNLWRPISDTEYPWTGMLFGAPILGVWYWCTDQYIVQRTLSARDIPQARKGAIFAGFLKLLPVFIFFIPGVIAYALMQRGDISFSMDNVDQALPAMIAGFLPTGIKGLAIAGLLAALMSSLSSAFNSSSTLLTIDFYQQRRPQATEKELVRFGQISTLILVVVSLGWIPFMKFLMGGGIFQYLQSIQAYISPPIAAVFLLGLFFPWIHSKGAITALWVGFVIGMFRLVSEFLSNEGSLTIQPNSFLEGFLQINFLHFALYLFLLCGLILILVSRFTTDTSGKDLSLLTFQQGKHNKESQLKLDRILTLLLILCVLIIWFVFSPWGMA